MATPPLSPAETAFTQQFQATIDTNVADLAELYQSMSAVSYTALRNAEAAIIARLHTINGFTQEVAANLHALSQQTLDLIYRNLPAPAIDFENEWIPVLLTTIERGRFNGTLASLGYQAAAGYSLVDPQQAMRSVGQPLGRFLAAVSTQSVSTAVAPNVTVTNNANGWTIVYTPIYVTSENGLGGPSSPVSGFISPGRYRFGIKQTLPAQWHSTSWILPASPSVHVPLP